eukprot:399222_1
MCYILFGLYDINGCMYSFLSDDKDKHLFIFLDFDKIAKPHCSLNGIHMNLRYNIHNNPVNWNVCRLADLLNKTSVLCLKVDIYKATLYLFKHFGFKLRHKRQMANLG